MEDAQSIATADAFYKKVALDIKSRGSTVSVMTMEGEDCKLEFLGTVADITGKPEKMDFPPFSPQNEWQGAKSRSSTQTSCLP